MLRCIPNTDFLPNPVLSGGLALTLWTGQQVQMISLMMILTRRVSQSGVNDKEEVDNLNKRKR